MPISARYFIITLIGIGFGALTWGIGGLLQWEAQLWRLGDMVLMDAKAAIGIGVGCLAGAATALLLFRSPDPAQAFGKKPANPDDFR